MLVLVAGAGVLSYLALTRDTGATVGVALDDDPTESASAAVPGADPSPTDDAVKLPKVRDQRRVDFTQGDDLPDGATIVDLGDNESGLALSAEGLTHGVPGDTGGSGFIETRLKAGVEKLGVRVQFAAEASGSVVLVAWRTSLSAAVAKDEALPRTGLRLVASPGSWALSVIDEAEEVVGKGTYTALAGETASFEVVRDGSDVYVVDPSGAVTTVSVPAAEGLSGPWASWGLLEGGPDVTPAVIQSVWAG